MDKLRAAYRVTVIVGLAMMASLVAYLVVVSLIENGTIAFGEQAAIPAGPGERIKFVLLGLSIVLFLLIRPVNRKVIGPGERSASGRGGRPGPEQRGGRDPGPLAVAAIITFALCEVPAIFGLVLYFLTRNVTDFYLFLIISLFFFSFHFPKFSQWEAWFRQPR